MDPVFTIHKHQQVHTQDGEAHAPHPQHLKKSDVAKAFDWKNAATRAFQKIRRRLAKLPTLTVPKKGEGLMAIAGDRNFLHSNREGGTGIGSHGKVLKDNLPEAPNKVITDRHMEKMLKLSGTKGRLAKWAAELRTYHVSYIQWKEAEGQVEEQILTLRAQSLYVKRGADKKGSGVGIILDSLEGKVYSYAIRLNFYASKDTMDYEALLAGLVASANRGIKDLHVLMDSKMLVDQVERSRIPRTKEAKKYKEEIMDATTPFHRFHITHLPKSLNPKAKALVGLASIKLELLNQEVSMGIKKRPMVEATGKDPRESKKATTKEMKPTWGENNGSN
uniref:RNase H type-1 domain-containing protein n=1 Tax=Tanacetum cinerariifolium TaxID=118510 RepID=A0A6L2MTM4_TANCI|nr:hypothetical protein [Tanacetum cinerariifolium]